jgi:hypothetical protein
VTVFIPFNVGESHADVAGRLSEGKRTVKIQPEKRLFAVKQEALKF